MTVLHIDYETRSEVDLFNEGVYKYAKHPSTEIICMSWAFDDEDVATWVPGDTMPFPQRVYNHMMQNEPRSIHAHNAGFERLITWYVLQEAWHDGPPPIEAFYCTAAQAAARGYPRALADLCKALQLPSDKSKDTRGRQLIKLLCIPQADGTFNRDPELLQEMYRYCERDVISERAAEGRTLPLSDREFRSYCLNEHINDQGLMIDREFAEAATQYADEEKQAIVDEIIHVTGGEVHKSAGPKMSAWVFDRLSDELLDLCTYYKEGVKKFRLDKFTRERILAVDNEVRHLDPATREVIELVAEAGRSSVAKYRNMIARADDDDVVRGAYVYAGAGQTKRYSSRGLQVHNFLRKVPKTEKDVARIWSYVIDGYDFADVLDTLATMLRPTIIAPEGETFVCGDFSSIEAVCTPWLARNEPRLDMFRETFADPDVPDVYERAAAGIYRKNAEDVTHEERQIGKVGELSLGFCGGNGAFHGMARNYGIILPDEQVTHIVGAWREHNPWARELGRELNSAAMEAIFAPEQYQVVCGGRLQYVSVIDDEVQHLFCILPSGEFISYPDVRVGEGKYGMEITALKGAWKPKQNQKEWPRNSLWHGLLIENAVQATCAEILNEGIMRVDNLDWLDALVGHTHDELLLQVEEEEADDAETILRRAMTDPITWLPDFPLNASFWTGTYYRKD